MLNEDLLRRPSADAALIRLSLRGWPIGEAGLSTTEGCLKHLVAANRGRTIRAEGETTAVRLAAPELSKLDGSRNGAGQGG
jgi:hypothetical protein